MRTREERRAHLDRVIGGLEARLLELQSRESRLKAELSPVPKIAAIYLLTEGDKPLYIGRTRNLRQQLGSHMSPSGDRYTATFAFRLAKEEAKSRGIDIQGTNAELEAQPRFQPLFLSAKERVSRMGIKFIEVEDPIEQTLLEVYAAESLGTRYNSFETH